jgi:hypothetical protein
MKKAIALALVGLAIGTVGVEARAGASHITSLGEWSCGDWYAHKPSDPNKPSLIRSGQINWLIGYMTGLASASGEDILASTGTASVVLWMDNWCQANPLESIAGGGLQLFIDLEKRIKPMGGAR